MTRRRPWLGAILMSLALGLSAAPGFADPDHDHHHAHEHHDHDRDEDEARDRPGPIHQIVFWIPNRVLDLFDVVRARVRLGPGIAVGARATELVDVYLGSYTSVYVGLPGPRGRRVPRLPVGVEGNHGIEVSVADGTTGFGFAPDYGPAEIGAGAQVALVGFDLGIEPLELVDFVVGFVGIDLREDDL